MDKPKLNLHCLRHVPFEGPAHIETWAKERGHGLTGTALHKGEPLPVAETFDCLVVMGGPMSVNAEEAYPWLAKEKRFIESAIAGGKIVLGICLGAQLIANVLGAKVYENKYKEIGWYPVRLTPEGREDPAFRAWPEEFLAFHWHGDTFEIPSGAVWTASSRACSNQAFGYGDRVIGLQFHLEATNRSVGALIANCGDELVEGEFIQPRERLRSLQDVAAANKLMAVLLDNLAAPAG